MVLSAEWLSNLAHTYGLNWQPTNGYDRAVVYQPGQVIAAPEILAAVKGDLIAKGMPGNFSIRSSTSTSVETKGWVQFEGDVTIRTGGDLTLKNYLGFDPGLSGETAILSAGGKFLNTGTPLTLNRGAGVPPLVSQLPYVNRMLVFSADPRNDNYGTNTSTWYPSVNGDPRMEGRIYNKSYADLASLPSGNWFVHSLAPVVRLTPGSTFKTYGDANPDLASTWTASGVILDDVISGGPTVATTTTTQSTAGNYPITLTNAGNVSGPSGYQFVVDNSTPGTLTVDKRTVNITAQDVTRQYGDANPSPFPADYAGLMNWDKDPVTGAPLAGVIGGVRLYASTSIGGAENVTQQTGVGTYPITWSGNWGGITSQNYSVTGVWVGTLTINPASLTATADNIIRRIGDPNPTPTFRYTGLKSWDQDAQGNPNAGVVSCCFWDALPGVNAPAGPYPINPNGGWAPNYAIAYVPGTLTVKAPYQLIITGDDKNRIYGNSNPTFTWTYAGFEDGDTAAVVSGVQAATTAGDRSAVGWYPISLSGGAIPPYYTVSYVPGRLQVTPRDLHLRALDASTRYGIPPVLTYATDGLLAGDSLSSPPTLTPGGGLVGTYPIFLTAGAAGPNYTIFRHNGTLDVTGAPLSVQANNTSIFAGQPIPPFTATLTGLQGGDTASALQGLNLTATDPTAGANGSSLRPIVQAGPLTAANYGPILFTPGVLTILPAPPVLITTTISTMTVTGGTGNGNQSGYWPILSPPFGVPAEGANALRYVAWNVIRQLGLNVTNIDAWMMDPANRALMTPALFEFLKAPLQPGTGLYNQREIVKTAMENQMREMQVKIAEDAVARYNAWKAENAKTHTRFEGLLGNLDTSPEDFVASATSTFLQSMTVASMAALAGTIVAGATGAAALPAIIAPFASSVLGTATASGTTAAMMGGAIGISGVAAGVVLAVMGTVMRAIQFVEYQKVEDKYNNLVNDARSFNINTLLSGDSNAQSTLFGMMLAIASH